MYRVKCEVKLIILMAVYYLELFFILNSYTTGLSPSVMGYILGDVLKSDLGGEVLSDEIGLKVSSTNLILPCGATSIWSK